MLSTVHPSSLSPHFPLPALAISAFISFQRGLEKPPKGEGKLPWSVKEWPGFEVDLESSSGRCLSQLCHHHYSSMTHGATRSEKQKATSQNIGDNAYQRKTADMCPLPHSHPAALGDNMVPSPPGTGEVPGFWSSESFPCLLPLVSPTFYTRHSIKLETRLCLGLIPAR
jgi:hypothetical protein